MASGEYHDGMCAAGRRPAATAHEVIRRHAQAAGMRVKEEGAENDLLERLAADPINMTRQDMEAILDVRQFVGARSPAGGRIYYSGDCPFLERNAHRLGATSDVRV